MMPSKNQTISESLKKTKLRRKTQECKVFELKVDKSHLNKKTADALKRMFLEAKWLYNHALSEKNKKNIYVSSKIAEIPVKVKDEYHMRRLKTLSAQMRQSVIDGLRQNICNLAKENGIKVGALNFVSHYDSIDMKQSGDSERAGTHRIVGNRIQLSKIPKLIRVNGVEQINGYEVANAKLTQKAGDYYVHVTCYREKQETPTPQTYLGTDFGLEHQLAISTGKEGLLVDYQFKFPKRLRRLYRQLSRKKKHSNNWYKQLT